MCLSTGAHSYSTQHQWGSGHLYEGESQVQSQWERHCLEVRLILLYKLIFFICGFICFGHSHISLKMFSFKSHCSDFHPSIKEWGFLKTKFALFLLQGTLTYASTVIKPGNSGFYTCNFKDRMFKTTERFYFIYPSFHPSIQIHSTHRYKYLIHPSVSANTPSIRPSIQILSWVLLFQ